MPTDITLTWSDQKKDDFYRDAQEHSLSELAELYGIGKTTARQIRLRMKVPEKSKECKERIRKKVAAAAYEGQMRMTEEARKQMFENSTQAFKMVVKQERRRVLFDLPQRTNIKLSLNIKAARKRAMAKARMVHRNGYISTGKDSRELLYDDNTRRSLVMEETNGVKYKFIFKPAEGFNEADSIFVNNSRWKKYKKRS